MSTLSSRESERGSGKVAGRGGARGRVLREIGRDWALKLTRERGASAPPSLRAV